MMRKVAAFFVLLCVAAAQDKGGKVPWNKDPQTAMALAKKKGQAMMLYFTSEG